MLNIIKTGASSHSGIKSIFLIELYSMIIFKLPKNNHLKAISL
jgi:hypothetical protein